MYAGVGLVFLIHTEFSEFSFLLLLSSGAILFPLWLCCKPSLFPPINLKFFKFRLSGAALCRCEFSARTYSMENKKSAIVRRQKRLLHINYIYPISLNETRYNSPNWRSCILLSFLNLLQDKSFHMLAITIGLFNGLYPENKVKDMEYPNTSQNDPSHRNSMHHNKADRH